MGHYRIELVLADDRDAGDTQPLDDERLPLAVGRHQLMTFAVADRHGVKDVLITAEVTKR